MNTRIDIDTKQSDKDIMTTIDTISFQSMKYLIENSTKEDNESEGENVFRRLPHYIANKLKGTRFDCYHWIKYSDKRWLAFWKRVEVLFEEM